MTGCFFVYGQSHMALHSFVKEEKKPSQIAMNITLKLRLMAC